MKINPFIYHHGRTCNKCILDDTIADIVFDVDGVCNFCKLHHSLELKYPLDNDDKLNKLILKIKKDGKRKKYDCIVGVSGGRDSTYTLLKSIELGLRPLAVHFDNGWNSKTAVENIKRITDKLGVDLYTYVANWEEFKDLQRAFLFASVPDAEVPTDWVIFSVLFQEAAKRNIKHIIHGHSFRTEGTTPITWTYMDARYIIDVHNRFGNKNKLSFPNMGLIKYLYYSFIKGIKQVRILYHIPYNEKEVLSKLENELGWINYGEKHHESQYTSFFQSYILTRKFNIDKRKLHYSAKIRNGQISRQDAKEIVSKDPYKGGTELFAYCLKKLDLSEKEFEDIMISKIKSFRDYNSYYDLIKTMKYPIKWGNKLKIIPDTVYKKFFNS
tara:strand:+ start:776 stop:1927 length:1152 start_codon:yes stop_codon:yes gene_type:complete